jgi:hypothetical protein
MQLSQRTRQALWIVFTAYLVLLGLSVFTEAPYADVGVEIAFILIVLGFAWFSYREFGHEPLGLVTSAALAGAAVGTAANLVLEIPAIGVTADVLLFGGIAVYLYLRWKH